MGSSKLSSPFGWVWVGVVQETGANSELAKASLAPFFYQGEVGISFDPSKQNNT